LKELPAGGGFGDIFYLHFQPVRLKMQARQPLG
jgi:hypothetical protein